MTHEEAVEVARVIKIFLNRMPSACLTYLAEDLGKASDSELVRLTLLPLLNHDDAVVREGALYGISYHVNSEVIDKVSEMAKNDSSRTIRMAAQEIIDEYRS